MRSPIYGTNQRGNAGGINPDMVKGEFRAPGSFKGQVLEDIGEVKTSRTSMSRST